MIYGILAEDFARNWGNIKPAFENFAERSDERWTIPYLVEEVLAKRKQVWRVGDWRAVVITSVGPDHEYVTLEACYGEGYQDWYEELQSALEMWAKELGAKRMFGMARPGWTKAFKAQGYREIHREFVKEI